MTRMIYVRHGESNTTVARVIGGYRTCTGLSPLGVLQTERLRDRWISSPEFEPDVVITSHYSRARQTAEILGQCFPGVPIVEDDGFGEHDPGEDIDGMGFDEFIERFGTQNWEDDPFAVTFPGGETLAHFHYRVGVAVRRSIEQYEDRTVLVACHGGVIDAVLRQALKTAPTGAFNVTTLNTSITELALVSSNKWALRRYGDVAHLAGLPQSTAAATAAAG